MGTERPGRGKDAETGRDGDRRTDGDGETGRGAPVGGGAGDTKEVAPQEPREQPRTAAGERGGESGAPRGPGPHSPSCPPRPAPRTAHRTGGSGKLPRRARRNPGVCLQGEERAAGEGGALKGTRSVGRTPGQGQRKDARLLCRRSAQIATSRHCW
jgi:hypothetical protein